MSEPERWIVIPNWPELQHYKKRDPAWIKLYTRLLHKDEYAELTYRQRGILHSLWMLYAASNGLVNGSHPARLGRLLGSVPVRARDIDALNHAGYITLSASRPLALRYQRASPEQRQRHIEQEQGPTSKADAQPANGTLDTEKTLELTRIINNLRNVEPRTWDVLEPLANQVPLAVLADLRTRSAGKGPGWVVRALQAEIRERAA